MSAGHRLWFHIERLFFDVHRLCREAKAAELRAASWKSSKDVISELKNSIADDVTEQIPTLTTSDLGETSSARGRPGGADIVTLRAELRKRLKSLQARLAEQLIERECYYAMFPIVIYVDELVLLATEGRAAEWQPLQRELYDVDNGGELFFTILESLLKKDETMPLIFEIFYFCLRDGFLGMHQTDRQKIEEYESALVKRIPVQLPDAGDPYSRAAVELVDFPRWYYLGAAGVIVIAFVLFHLSARFESALG